MQQWINDLKLSPEWKYMLKILMIERGGFIYILYTFFERLSAY